ncbi:expressed unknown protein [Seminavis robusta]|uniref:Uncharacterized protein n=1 Tax=Seminavis robusta TaxID=568900 RepID=A0A9N8E313_9STRA|nr:expressed unknown protein [Seminavis robusta]|eukprot:Sro566_g167800.1 n/a (147) ;mRNA; f:25708-26148
MCQATIISLSPLENLFLGVRVVAHTAGTKLEQIREDTQRAVAQKRQRFLRSNQATIFAEEEARLHEQVMIEQEIFERQRLIAAQPAPETAQPKPQETNGRIVLAPRTKQAQRVKKIESKLALIRRNIQPPKNTAGVASLQAAVAAF